MFNRKMIVLVLIFLPHVLLAEPEISEEFSYYLIYPETPSEIADELTSRSPVKENGKIFRGHTEWNVNWNYWWQTDNGECRINKVKTGVVIKYTMPKLPDSHKNDQIEKKFNPYFDALMLHEHGHRESGITAAREIENMLHSLPGYPDCGELDKVANKKATNIIRKFNKKDLVYDYKTDHGRTQGATID